MTLGDSHTYIDVVIKGKDRTFDLTNTPTLSIGRNPRSSVVLDDDPMVSRKHALVQRGSSGDYYLSDLGSRNGTTRNGVPVTSPVALNDGDSFTIGSHRFVFHNVVDPDREEGAEQDPTDVLVVERMITILVLDMRDYTVLAREVGESQITEIMNKLFHRAGEVLESHRSWGQKYIGDAVMGLWVHGDEEGTPPEVGLLFESLVGLSAIFDDLNEEFDLPRRLAFGVGVNSGLAVTGNMGSAALSDHTAMGDAVNKAFRLESATKQVGQEVVVGEATYRMMRLPDDIAALFSTHDVELKGYDEPEAVRALSLDDLPRLVEALRS